MSQFLPLLLPLIASLIVLKFFPWPLPYYTVVDSLYGTLGLNYLNLAVDFLVIFLLTAIVVGLVELLLMILVFKSLLKEMGRKE